MIARYYFRRRPLTQPPANNTLTVYAPNPWKWARIRGCDVNGQQLGQIVFTASAVDHVKLVVPVSANDQHLARSVYEIVLGHAQDEPDDPALMAPNQDPIPGAGITYDDLGGFDHKDKDPPPPPHGDFQATINIP
jgi:hypothetical protein